MTKEQVLWTAKYNRRYPANDPRRRVDEGCARAVFEAFRDAYNFLARGEDEAAFEAVGIYQPHGQEETEIISPETFTKVYMDDWSVEDVEEAFVPKNPRKVSA
jgi:hypothetical protein